MQSQPDSAPCFQAGDLLHRAACLAGWLASQADAESSSGGGFPTKEFGWMADEGWLAAPLQRRLGGRGLGSEPGSASALLQTLKQIGRGQLAVGRIYEGHVNALQLIQLFGTPEQIERYAADARDHHRIFGVWNAEARAGGLQIIPLGGNRCHLEGGKLFASGLGHVERPIVTGRLPDGGWQMCVVAMEEVVSRADHSWWRPLGMERTVSGSVDFSGVEIDSDALIGPADTYYREPWFNGGSIRFMSVQLGGAEALYDAARAFLRETGLADHPAQRTRVAEMAVAIESGDLWLKGAAASAERAPKEAEAITVYAGMARIAIENICLDVIRASERCVGARGLIRPWPFERMIRDLTMYLRQPAPDSIVERVGRHALNDSRPASEQWGSGHTVNDPSSLPPGYFEDVYRANADPWNFASSPYEAAKYRATLDALPKPLYRSGFEAGCSIGVLTERLAARCERLLAIDVNEVALTQARARCASLENVLLQRCRLPAQFPARDFDLILVSEVGYYLAMPDLLDLRARCLSRLVPGGHLLLVHWTPFVPDYPLTGDQVHESFLELATGAAPPLCHLLGSRQERYRLDLFERAAT